MNLTGSRSTLIANVCALIVASVVVAEGAYIVHKCYGYYRPQDAWVFFTPAVVMFIIRNRKFSYVFLCLYAALSFGMFLQILRIPLDLSSVCGGKGDPLGFLILVFLVPVVCLLAYLATVFAKLASVVARLAISKLNSPRN